LQKRLAKETNQKKRPTKKTYKTNRDLKKRTAEGNYQKRPEHGTYERDLKETLKKRDLQNRPTKHTEI